MEADGRDFKIFALTSNADATKRTGCPLHSRELILRTVEFEKLSNRRYLQRSANNVRQSCNELETRRVGLHNTDCYSAPQSEKRMRRFEPVHRFETANCV